MDSETLLDTYFAGVTVDDKVKKSLTNILKKLTKAKEEFDETNDRRLQEALIMTLFNDVTEERAKELVEEDEPEFELEWMGYASLDTTQTHNGDTYKYNTGAFEFSFTADRGDDKLSLTCELTQIWDIGEEIATAGPVECIEYTMENSLGTITDLDIVDRILTFMQHDGVIDEDEDMLVSGLEALMSHVKKIANEPESGYTDVESESDDETDSESDSEDE